MYSSHLCVSMYLFLSTFTSTKAINVMEKWPLLRPSKEKETDREELPWEGAWKEWWESQTEESTESWSSGLNQQEEANPMERMSWFVFTYISLILLIFPKYRWKITIICRKLFPLLTPIYIFFLQGSKQGVSRIWCLFSLLVLSMKIPNVIMGFSLFDLKKKKEKSVWKRTQKRGLN